MFDLRDEKGIRIATVSDSTFDGLALEDAIRLKTYKEESNPIFEIVKDMTYKVQDCKLFLYEKFTLQRSV